MNQRAWCKAWTAAGLLLLGACHDGSHKKSHTPPDAGEDASLPPVTLADAGNPDAGPALDAGPKGDPCVRACAIFTPLLQDQCGGLSDKPEYGAAARHGFHAAPQAVAVQLTSSEAGMKSRLKGMFAVPTLYAPSAGVVLVTRAREGTLETLRTLWPSARQLPVLTTAQGRQVVVPGRIVVRVRANSSIQGVLTGVDARLVRALDVAAHTYLVEVDEPMQSFVLAEQLSKASGVVYAEASLLRTYKKRAPIDDPLTAKQWHLVSAPDSGATSGTNIMADYAWRVSEGSKDTVVGIFDDGVDFEHEDLKSAIVPGINIPTTLQTAIDQGCCWHGTGVAGVATAQANTVGLRGVCPSCSLMPIFETSSDGSDQMLSEDAVTAELFTNGCKTAAVINNSWGPADGDPAVVEAQQKEELPAIVDDALTYCETMGRNGLGTVIVFAAGNGNESTATDPFASHPLTVAVAAVDDTGRKSYYSDFGASVDVSAPSDGGRTTGIWTTALRMTGDQEQQKYMDNFGGTSSAAPVVTGLVGLILSVNPQLTAKQVRELLASTADKVDRLNAQYDKDGFSVVYGHGRVNAYRAVREAEKLAGKCTDLGEELCNGVDDNCEGTIDENCTKVETCGACEFDAACVSGSCAQTPQDTEPRCLEACDNGACADGYVCQAELCVPADGRCADKTKETCNGVDDDLNGKVDEGVCPGDQSVECMVDAACSNGKVCAGGYCLSTCTEEAECTGEREQCSERTDRYGRTDGVKVCYAPYDPCLDEVCALDDAARNTFVACVAADPMTCDELYACIPPELLP
jgi:subtilisin family serine protease